MKNILSIVAIVLLVLGSLLIGDTPPLELIAPDDVKQTAPDSYMTGVESKSYNKLGEQDYFISTKRLEHFDSKNRSTLDQPYFVLFKHNQRDWQGQALSGVILNNGELIQLREDVKLWNDETPDNKQQLITTQLTLRPDEKIAETDKAVRISSPQHLINATGMQAKLNHQIITFNHRVRSTHEVN